jgi:polynucleotide 5'-hydroxyl-kinase GRC3/NOL9
MRPEDQAGSTFAWIVRWTRMDPEDAQPDADPHWRQTLNIAAERRRVLVVGPTDAGKSTFIRSLIRDKERALIDLDPGQKMIGPPGTASLGTLDPGRLGRMIFLGTTSASALGAIARASAELAASADGAFVVNTAGFVRGLGLRLQALTAAALAPDLIVEIGGDAAAPPIVALEGAALIRLDRSSAATRKSPAARAAIRQAAFEKAMRGATQLALPGLSLHPGAPAISQATYPVCSLADAGGEDMVIAVLHDVQDGLATVHAPPLARAAAKLRLGKMWAAPEGSGGWTLLEKLSPAWID